MPNKYKRIALATRGNWSEESLKSALIAIKNGELSIYKASIVYNVPRKTLERRYKTNNDKKGPMGPTSMLGDRNEKKLADHIKTMQAKGFPLTIYDVRVIAFQFAEQLNINHKFNKSDEKAGYDWLQMFLRRNPDIVLRKSEGVSIARRQGMNRVEVNAYFDLLEKNLLDNDLMSKPNCIFNMDESGLQLNNRPGHVLAEKGTKAVSTITSTEKGETITIIACCNAEGMFLPPACIMKGKNKKSEFEDGMPPGSRIFMSEKSAYITSAIFLEWLKIHFMPRKPQGKVLLLLDGHSTHCNSVEMLEYANENEIILLSMPSHTSHFLQPLDRAVFKSLKHHFYEQCRLWLKQNPGRRITRLSFGTLLNKAWGKAATAENAISGFKACGVFQFNPAAIPDYAFMSDSAETNTHPSVPISTNINIPNNSSNFGETIQNESLAIPGTSAEQVTPSRILKDLSPIPHKIIEARKRSKQVGQLLTSEEHITIRKNKEEEKCLKEQRRKIKEEKNNIKPKDKKTEKKKLENEKLLGVLAKAVTLISMNLHFVIRHSKMIKKTRPSTVLDAEKIISRLVLSKTGSSALCVRDGYMKIVPSLIIPAPHVVNERKKKLKLMNIKAKARRKVKEAQAISPVRVWPTHPDMPGEMANSIFF